MSVEREMIVQAGIDREREAYEFERKLESFGLKKEDEDYFRREHRLPGEYVDPYSIRDL